MKWVDFFTRAMLKLRPMGISTHLKVLFWVRLVNPPGENATIFNRLRVMRDSILQDYDLVFGELGKKCEIYQFLASDQGFFRVSKPAISNKFKFRIYLIMMVVGAIIFLWPSRYPRITRITKGPPLLLSIPWLVAMVLKVLDLRYWKNHFKVFNYLKERKELSKRVSGYLQDDTDFGNGDVSALPLPPEIWERIGVYLGVTDIVHISKVCKALHTVTQNMWDVQREKWNLNKKKNLSDKQRIKQEFCRVHLHCQKLFIDIFGVERILLMPLIPDITSLNHQDNFVSRTADCKAFMVCCRVPASSTPGNIVVLQCGGFYGLEARCSMIKLLSLPQMIIQYKETELKALFTTGSATFTYKVFGKGPLLTITLQRI